MASSAEPTVRTPFTLVETSTLDNTWNTSVTLSASTNYKEYKTVEGRTATAQKNCMNKIFLGVKDKYKDEAKTIFEDTTISVTTRGKRHLLLGQGTLPPNMSVAKLKSGVRS